MAQLGSWGQNENYVGGIAGYAGENTAIAACVNKGNVFGTGLVGGIAGASGNFIINCANHGDLEAAEGGKVYGIASLAVNGLLNCYNTGDITGDRLACGIGSSSKAVTINLYNYGTITCTAGDGVLTDAFPWSSGGAATGLLNTYSRENCIVAPDGGSGSVSVQAVSYTHLDVYKRQVVDYFSIQRGRLKNVVLNLGDVYIFVGGTILLLKELAGTIKNR